MAADARTDLAPPRALSLAALRITPVQALTAVIAASVIGRTLAAWFRTTPIYFPDEYIYSEVGRSIADHGRPLVRGASAHFPALLQPILTAPAWLFDDVDTSFRTIQLINSVVMSLGAVAVFWLARRLGLSPWVAVAVAAFSLAIPDMLYAGWILADPFAFPLVLAATAAATAALDRPTKATGPRRRMKGKPSVLWAGTSRAAGSGAPVRKSCQRASPLDQGSFTYVS